MEENVSYCHCGHKESEHVKSPDSDDMKCTVRGCKCQNFSPMDPEDVEFLRSLE